MSRDPGLRCLAGGAGERDIKGRGFGEHILLSLVLALRPRYRNNEVSV